jgi:glutaredoxin-related protein
MNLHFYHSPLCPRCFIARHILKKLLTQYPDIKLIEYDVLRDRQPFRNSGMKLIPALACNDKKMNGFLLSRKKITTFLSSISKRDTP